MLRHITLDSLKDQVADGLRPLQDLEVRQHLVRTVEAEQMIDNHHEDAYYRALAREDLSGHRQSKFAA
jgi:KaiC/GvpD/RAD55 family RecA-like ATPase